MSSDYDKVAGEPNRGPFPNAEAPAHLGRFNPKSRQKTAGLVAKVPQLATQLVKDEIAHAKLELKQKAVKGGAAAGLFAVVAFFGLTLWAVLITAAILGLAEAVAPWLAALIVAGALLVIMVIAAVVGIALFKKMNGVAPAESIDSIKQDLNAVKGLGKYE